MSDYIDADISHCADLVTFKNTEAFPLTLLTLHKSGEWVSVEKLCQGIGIATIGEKNEFVATWLPDPSGDPSYVVIIFYDDVNKESFAAYYNKSRLLDTIPTTRPEG